MARILAKAMSQSLKQPIVIDNRVGAGGNIGISQAARATPDGYTLLLNGNSHVINPALYSNANFDPETDFSPVGKIAEGTLLIVANPSFPANTVKELATWEETHQENIFTHHRAMGR